VDQRERDMAEEGLARQPQQNRTVLADRPEHAEIAECRIRFTQDMDAAMFELIDLVHRSFLRSHAPPPSRSRSVRAFRSATDLRVVDRQAPSRPARSPV